MANDYGPTPEVLDEWNSIWARCDCCEMPECATPILICESKEGVGSADGVAQFTEFSMVPTDELPSIYETDEEEDSSTIEWAGLIIQSQTTNTGDDWAHLYVTWTTATRTEEVTEHIRAEDEEDDTCAVSSSTSEAYDPLADGIPSGPVFTITANNPPECTATERTINTFRDFAAAGGGSPAHESCPGRGWTEQTITTSWPDIESLNLSITTLTDPKTKAECASDADAALAAVATWDPGEECDAAWLEAWPKRSDFPAVWPECDDSGMPMDAVGSVTKRKIHYRFRVPATHLGTYYKVTWDVIDVPTDPEEDPVMVEEANEEEWTGPGNVDPEHASWFLPWYEMAPPDVPGLRQVSNVRWECYAGPYGALPQKDAESWPETTIPE